MEGVMPKKDETRRQLSFSIRWTFSTKSADFVVSENNSYAFEWLEKWPFKIKDNFVCIVGESGSGKTHLANIWAARFGADVISATSGVFEKWYELVVADLESRYFVLDDADQIDEEILLFCIYNTILEKDAYLLMTAKTAPALWGLKLLDLKSRISTINVINIKRPDDKTMAEIMDKMLRQRGIQATRECVEYIVNRIERTYSAMNYWVRRIDASLGRGRNKKMTLARVRGLMSEATEPDND
jgi:chromosomal replication initiation ATPase DnaA